LKKDLFEYIIIYNDEVFINDNSTDRRIIVKYDDIHDFLVTHKKELLSATIVLDEIYLTGEIMNFVVRKMKEYVLIHKIYIKFYLHKLEVLHKSNISHVYNFIEKMENIGLKPRYFHINTINDCYTLGHEPYS